LYFITNAELFLMHRSQR